MATVREDRFFHLRGKHVQHSHSRNSTTEVEYTGAMIALLPSDDDARRLRIAGGESAEQLHLTLYYLGDGADWTESDRQAVVDSLIDAVADKPPGSITVRVFGVNYWNGNGESPCWVFAVGDAVEGDGITLEEVRSLVRDTLIEDHIPVQFTPWVPHLCAAYTGDVSLAAELNKRLGDVTFDRIRVAFSGEYTDISLGENLIAAGVLRRNPTDFEVRSRADFVRMQQEWESAIDSVLEDIQPIREMQREQITAAVLSAAQLDDLDALTSITVDDEALYTVLLGHMTRAANEAGQEQQREAEEQGVAVPEWSLDNMTAAVGLGLLQSIARVTARVINVSFVQSGVRRALSLVGRPAVSPEQAAEEVDSHLAELTDASPRESIGGAITAAQNEGRRTVLAAAPEADQYVASEILDRNVCAPCRAVDGQSFETLADAQEAYPSGGYRDCLGGTRCRGTIVAVWE